MSVIFKEKRYDHFILIIKIIALILIFLLILVFTINFYLKTKINSLKSELEVIKGEEIKYISLIKNKAETEKKDSKLKKHNLIIKLARYANNLNYNSIHLKNNKITINAVSKKQNYIFELLESLKDDKNFHEVNLLNIIQKDNYHFEVNSLFSLN